VVSIKKTVTENISIFKDGKLKRTAPENKIFKDGGLCQPYLKIDDF
jgi:hypothetical protein